MLRELGEKIEVILKRNVPIICETKFASDLYICGGLIKNTMINKKIKDIDLFLLGEKPGFSGFIKQNNLKYRLNRFGNPKAIINGVDVDLATLKSFQDAIVYNIDGLFYNLSQHQFVLAGFEDFVKKEKIEVVNSDLVNPNFIRVLERRCHLNKFARTIKGNGMLSQLREEICELE